MIINGFGSSGGKGFQDPNRWRNIVTFSVNNFSCSQLVSKGQSDGVAVAKNDDVNAWDWEALEQSLAVRVVCNNWTWGGSKTSYSGTSMMCFIVARSTSDSNGGRMSWYNRIYRGTISSTSDNIESIRDESYMGYAPISLFQFKYSSSGEIGWIYHAGSGFTSSGYFTYIARKHDASGNYGTVYAYPYLYGWGATSNFSNTTLSCSLSIQGFII